MLPRLRVSTAIRVQSVVFLHVLWILNLRQGATGVVGLIHARAQLAEVDALTRNVGRVGVVADAYLEITRPTPCRKRAVCIPMSLPTPVLTARVVASSLLFAHTPIPIASNDATAALRWLITGVVPHTTPLDVADLAFRISLASKKQ